MHRGKGLFTVKGDIGFMGRDIPRSCLTLLRTEEIVEDKLAKLNLKRKGPTKKEPVISKRHRSYQKAQAVARLQEEAVSSCPIQHDVHAKNHAIVVSNASQSKIIVFC